MSVVHRTVERRLAAESGQHHEVDIHRQARLTPALNCEAADETELPLLRLAHLLQRSSGLSNNAGTCAVSS